MDWFPDGFKTVLAFFSDLCRWYMQHSLAYGIT